MDRPTTKRGNFAVLFTLAIVVVFGFGALAVDVSYMRASQAQAQDVADAASQAATIMMRRTGEIDDATTAATRVVALNTVAGRPASLRSLEFGLWTQAHGENDGVFSATDVQPNAVRVEVDRKGGGSISHLLAGIFGYRSFEVAAKATSAGRNVHVILVMDITNSWNPVNFVGARAAALSFLDTMAGSAGPYDKIGMTVFTGRYGWEFTPLTNLRDPTALAAIRTSWSNLKTASKGGNGTNWPSYCTLNASGMQNQWNNPAGGCYPNMPREYTDEPGTDHTTGIAMARTMFAEDADTSAERVMVVLTDGVPNGIASSHGTLRRNAGYHEPRWREYRGPTPHTTSEVEWDSIQATADLWDDYRVHTYVVSFVSDSWFMHDMPRGQGYFVLTNSSEALTPIFKEIANNLPIAIVE